MPDSKITHDEKLDIAVGRHRRETTWKNTEMLWTEFVQKVSVTHRTAETLAEYMAAKKRRQDEIKDIGGFVGGYLNNGKRKNGNIVHRQLLTLDIDFGNTDVWADFTLLFDSAAVLYSTHKHSAKNPRYRLLIPLDRPVFAEEYQAIARKVASMLPVSDWDPTTFRVTQLMYWPSTSKDGEFVFENQDGNWLSADEVLNMYHDWQDASEWPMFNADKDIIRLGALKQGDPLEKPGMVGAFCRTYGIEEVIETYLPGVYEACDIEGRYTYTAGSTAGGLVIYEDKFAYSHHGTDPSGGKLCNAFDLVRIHKFGLKDEDAREGTPGNKLPSFGLMAELCTKDAKVRTQLGTERLSDARGDFEAAPEESEEETNNDWIAQLDIEKKSGKPKSTIDNVVIILNNDPVLKGKLALDLFSKREVALKNLPWRKITKMSANLIDSDDAAIRHYLESVYEITGKEKIKDGIDIVVQRNAFHPVKQYLNSLAWDGFERVETLFIDYMGCEDCEYTRAVSRKALAAAVARIFEPGCKFDYMIVLTGAQGKKKSMLLDKLGRGWFSDSLTTVEGTKAYEQIQGVWIMEMAELSSTKKADVDAVKHFVAKREDRFRVAYGRRTENFPRQCIFFGTSNPKEFLKDPTGNRRFWPLAIHEQPPTKDTFSDFTDAEVDQVWAEAIQLYKAKEKLYLTPELEEQAFAKQTEHSEVDERTGIISNYLNTLLPANWQEMGIYERRSYLQGDELQKEGTVQRECVCVAEIWCEVLGGTHKDMTTNSTKYIHDILKTFKGWKPTKGSRKFGLYGYQRGYERTNTKGFSTNTNLFVEFSTTNTTNSNKHDLN